MLEITRSRTNDKSNYIFKLLLLPTKCNCDNLPYNIINITNEEM